MINTLINNDKQQFHNRKIHHNMNKLLCVSVALFALSGCNMLSRFAKIGEAPALSKIEDPTERVGYKPISMPMPSATEAYQSTSNSLWRPGSKTFFKDQRANNIGDLITVLVDINDSAEVKNTSSTKRSSAETESLPALGGLEKQISKVLPGANPSSLLSASGNSANSGSGEIQRNEKISIKVSAVLTQILPNGNFVIHGRQETRINYEVRELQIAGVVRPQDITSQNTIALSQIAEARVSYGGKGSISDVQQARYGSQLVDLFLPF